MKLDCDLAKIQDLLSQAGGVIQFDAGSEEEFVAKKQQWEKVFELKWL